MWKKSTKKQRNQKVQFLFRIITTGEKVKIGEKKNKKKNGKKDEKKAQNKQTKLSL